MAGIRISGSVTEDRLTAETIMVSCPIEDLERKTSLLDVDSWQSIRWLHLRKGKESSLDFEAVRGLAQHRQEVRETARCAQVYLDQGTVLPDLRQLAETSGGDTGK